MPIKTEDPMRRLLPITIVSLFAVGGSLAAQQRTAIAVNTARDAGPIAISKAREKAFTTIQGNALNSTNGRMNDAIVRLRDARFGRIVDTQITDTSGMFAFKGIDAGSYVVELMSNEQSVMAASQLLNVNAGEAVSAVVKLPFRIPPFAGLMGSSSTPSAIAVAAEAAASSILAVVPTAPVSPVQ